MMDESHRNHANFALTYTWAKYREYAATSRKNKKRLTKWRRFILFFALAGALFGLLCQDSGRILDLCQGSSDGALCHFLNETGLRTSMLLSGEKPLLPVIFGILSALLLGMATYFGKELLGPEKEKEWIRCRTAAEFFKAEAYKFATQAPPYNGPDRSDRLFKAAEKMMETVKDLPCESLSETERKENLPPDGLTVEAYVADRLDNQIQRFYRKNAHHYMQKTGTLQKWILGLSAIGIFLGALGFTGWTAGWVALITTMTVSISGYAYANRYGYLIISYQATANRLEWLKARWLASGNSQENLAERNRLILDCEDAISIENSSWMAELAKQAPDTENGAARRP